ncbi:MAG: glycosyl transferase [Rariglobus sp.]|jgi:glycosyltransferase involved in cell wall biosynthesis|nr:glycosyl transferase [Rariglobus sp.]
MNSVSPVKFSVCIPVYEGREFLRETLASVRAQTWGGWELVVVEDGSREPVRDLVEAFSREVSQKVTYVAHDKNWGVAYARDTALEHASQEWIALLDADDFWSPDHLASLAATIAREEQLEFIFSSYRRLDGSFGGLGRDVFPKPADLERIRSSVYFLRIKLKPSCFAFSMRLLERTGPWSRDVDRLPWFLSGGCNSSEDRNFILRCVQADARMGWSGELTVNYRKHPAAMTVTSSDGPVYRASYYHLHGSMRGISKRKQRQFIAKLQVEAARNLKQDGRMDAAAWFFFRAWCWQPREFSRLVKAVRVLLWRR